MYISNQKITPAEQKVLLDGLRAACDSYSTGGIIPIIKALRALVPGLGLADAKQIVDNTKTASTTQKKYEAIISQVQGEITPDITKEEFLSLLGNAIDNADAFFTDPLEAVLYMCQNLKARGGLIYAAKRNEKFINSI